MELQDITTLNVLKNQLSKIGSSIELQADYFQDLKKLNIAKENKNSELVKSLDEIQSLLYKASQKIAETTE